MLLFPPVSFIPSPPAPTVNVPISDVPPACLIPVLPPVIDIVVTPSVPPSKYAPKLPARPVILPVTSALPFPVLYTPVSPASSTIALPI